MRALLLISIVTSTTLALGHSIVAAQDQKATFLSCIDGGFSKLISAQNREFSSQQFYIVCQYRDVKKRERNETFSYYPPEGFKIVSVDVDVVSNTAQASVGDLTFNGQRAKINLQCQGRPDADHVHDGVAVKLFGGLEYQPTVNDLKDIAVTCLD